MLKKEFIRWNRAYDLSEIPMFIRAGAVIPMLPLELGNTVGRASQQYEELDIYLAIAPGATSGWKVLFICRFSEDYYYYFEGSSILYEDDGISTDYATKQSYYKSSISYSRPSANRISIQVSTPAGNGYAQFPTERTYTFRYIGAPPCERRKGNFL